MEIWGAGAFENETALKWLKTLTGENSVGPVVEALEAIVAPERGVDKTKGCEALAAAELVASLNPDETTVLPDEVQAWLKRQKLKPTGQLVRLARQAVGRVQGHDSELRTSWLGAERGGREWSRTVQELVDRLDYEAADGSLQSSRWWRLW